MNLQRRLCCPTCLSGSATVVLLDICFNMIKQPSVTSFMSIIIIVWCTGISSSSVSPGTVPYTLERDDGGQIRWAWYPVYQAFQSHSWSSSVCVVLPSQMVPDFPHPPFPWGLISALLFHYQVRKCILVAEPIVVKQRRHWCKQFIMVHTYTCSFCLHI